MPISEIFEGDLDALTDALVLVEARVMPVVDWLDDVHDPKRNAQIAVALFVLLARRLVKQGYFRTEEEALLFASALFYSTREDAYDPFPVPD